VNVLISMVLPNIRKDDSIVWHKEIYLFMFIQWESSYPAKAKVEGLTDKSTLLKCERKLKSTLLKCERKDESPNA
jgi:hypothetical protein